MEDSLVTIARKNVATRFIKLHHEIAEMENVTPPALIAYKRGDVFASIMDIISQLPSGRDLSPASLEDLLKLYVHFFYPGPSRPLANCHIDTALCNVHCDSSKSTLHLS